METQETKNKLEETRELTRGLAVAAVEAARNLEKIKIVMLASINFLLEASPDILDEDIAKELKHTQKWLTQDVAVIEANAAIEAAESKADAVIEEAVTKPERNNQYTLNVAVEQIEEVLDRYVPDFQLKVMQVLADRQPQRFAEYDTEMIRDEARDNLINSANELPMDVQTKLYRMFHVTVEDEGKEIAA